LPELGGARSADRQQRITPKGNHDNQAPVCCGTEAMIVAVPELLESQSE
jgi:hypothetical protein